MKVLVLTSYPEYCNWKNVDAAYLVPSDFDYEAALAGFNLEFGASGIDLAHNGQAGLSVSEQKRRLFHDYLRARFPVVEHHEEDETHF